MSSEEKTDPASEEKAAADRSRASADGESPVPPADTPNPQLPADSPNLEAAVDVPKEDVMSLCSQLDKAMIQSAPEEKTVTNNPVPSADAPSSVLPDTPNPQLPADSPNTEAAVDVPKEVENLSSQLDKVTIQSAAVPNPGQSGFTTRPLPTHEDKSPAFLVEANYFAVHYPDDVYIFQYDVDIRNGKDLPMKKTEFTSKAFWYAYRVSMSSGANIFPSHKFLAYNGRNILWSTQKIKMEDEVRINFTVDPPSNDPRKPVKVYKMTVKYVRLVKMKARPENIVDQMALASILDAILSARLTCLYEPDSESFFKSGKAMFYTKNDRGGRYASDMGEALEAWTGLHGAIKTSLQAGLLLNVDTSHSAFFKRGYSLIDFVSALANIETGGGSNPLPGNAVMSLGQRKKLESVLKGLTLEFRSFQGRKTFKFTEMTDKPANGLFFMHNNSQTRMSVATYYQQAYGYTLRYPYLPCFFLNKIKRSFAPFELIFLDDIVTKFKGRISERELRKLTRATSFPPDQRKKLIEEMARAEEQNQPVYLEEQDEYMKNFGVKVDRNFMKVKASLIPGPSLEFGEGAFWDENNEGVWDLKNGQTLKKLKSEKPTIIPALIFLTPDAQNAKNQGKYDCNPEPLGFLMEALYHAGANCPGGKDYYLVDKFDWYAQKWEVMLAWMREFKEKVNTDKRLDPTAIPLAVFVFPYKCIVRDHMEKSSEYENIKYICDVTVGVHCQCILQKTFSAMSSGIKSSTAQYVAMKILGKIGATLYTIEGINDGCWKRLTNPEKPTLILGIDVTHAGAEERKEGKYSALSVAAVVGNIDVECMNYGSSHRTQAIGDERTFHIQPEVKTRILEFHSCTGKWPAHIVVYRDSVSESQFEKIFVEEKAAIMGAIREIQNEEFKTPTLTYLVNQKRHHARFFPLQKENTVGEMGNLKPGTLIESSVTSKNLFDFYLYGHQGTMGTSRPAHICVLWDEWAPSADFWQKISFYLCYGFIRCTSSISQPAPVAYAHLAAKRAKDYLKAHINLNNTKFKSMNELEIFNTLSHYIQKNEKLKGMVFV